MTRTDIHAPSNLIPEDYEFAYAFDAHPESGERQAARVMLNLALEEGFRFGRIHGGDQCDHCGARLRYIAVLKHLPTKTMIYVGEDCLARFDMTSDEFHTLRTEARLNRERTAKAVKIAAAVEANPLLAWLTYPEALHGGRTEPKFCEGSCFYTYETCKGHTDYADFNSFLDSVAEKFRRYADLSEKQIAAVERAIIRDTERRDRKAERVAADLAAKAAGEIEPVPADAGRIKITGEVISQKTVEGDYGVQFKMLVRDDRGFKVWGTEPSSISPEKGSRVSFMAKVERSKDDEFFGFFSRPTKAEILDA